MFGSAGLSNTVIPALAEVRGFDPTLMTSWLSYAGWLAIPVLILWTQLGQKIGSKRVILLTLGLSIVGFIIMGSATTVGLWIVGLVIDLCVIFGFFMFGGPALIANWFPTKKGLALGWASMGLICSDILWVPYAGQLIHALGPTMVFVGASVLVVIFMVVIALTVKERPEEAGAFPDNLPEEAETQRKIASIQRSYKTKWGFKRLLTTKEVWMIGIAGGFLWMCGGGPITCFYPRMLSFGYEQVAISAVFQSIAFISLFGSWLLGVLDLKLGTKTSFIICGALVFIGDLLMFLWAPHSIVGALVAAACLGISIGGVPNLLASIQTTFWGRWDYPACSKIIMPIASALLASNFFWQTLSLNFVGSYDAFFVFMLCVAALSILLLVLLKPRMLGITDQEIVKEYDRAPAPQAL